MCWSVNICVERSTGLQATGELWIYESNVGHLSGCKASNQGEWAELLGRTLVRLQWEAPRPQHLNLDWVGLATPRSLEKDSVVSLILLPEMLIFLYRRPGRDTQIWAPSNSGCCIYPITDGYVALYYLESRKRTIDSKMLQTTTIKTYRRNSLISKQALYWRHWSWTDNTTFFQWLLNGDVYFDPENLISVNI